MAITTLEAPAVISQAWNAWIFAKCHSLPDTTYGSLTVAHGDGLSNDYRARDANQPPADTNEFSRLTPDQLML